MRVCIFCGSSKSKDPQVESEIKKVMRSFFENDIELVYGGASIGIMGDLANELLNLGGSVIGVIPRQLTKLEISHGGLTQLHVVKDMHERKKMMYDLSDAFLVFPGGMGTMDELFEILTWKQIGLHGKPIALLNINGYFDHLLKFLDHTVEQGLLKPHDRSYLFSSQNWDEIKELFKR
jgi:uncharacterized protein (TIGR00730 family)